MSSCSVRMLVLLLAATAVEGRADEPAAKKAATLWDHRGSVLSVAFSPDRQTLATGGRSVDGGATLWDLETGRRRCDLDGAGLVYGLAFAPDGKRVATAGYVGVDKQDPHARAAVWDAATGKELFALQDYPGGEAPCVAFAPDGKTLATGGVAAGDDSAVGVVQLWDAETGRVRSSLHGHDSSIGALAYSPDGKTLATAGFGPETKVILWETATGRQRLTLKSPTTWAIIRSLAFSPDGKMLAWAAGNEINGNSQLFVWDAATGKRLAALQPESGWCGVAFSPDGKTLAAGGFEKTIHLWDVPEFRERAAVQADFHPMTMLRALAFSPDGKALAAGSSTYDALGPPAPMLGEIKLWDAKTLTERLAPAEAAARAREEEEQRKQEDEQRQAREERRRRAKEDEDRLSDGQRADLKEARDAGRRVRYALGLRQAQRELEQGRQAVAAELLDGLAPQPGEEDLRGFEWRLLRRLCSAETRTLDLTVPVFTARIAEDRRTVVVSTWDQTLTVWDAATGKRKASFADLPFRISEHEGHMALSPDGGVLAATGGDRDDPSAKEVRIWDTNTGKSLAVLVHADEVRCLAFSPDGTVLATGDEGGGVRVWDAASGRPVGPAAQQGEQNRVEALAFSPDGKTLASGGPHGVIHLWAVGTQKEEAVCREKDGPGAQTLLFAPDGTTLFDAGGERNKSQARQWDVTAGRPPSVVQRWDDVDELALSPDGGTLALGDWGELTLWNVAKGKASAKIPGPQTRNYPLVFSPDGKFLLVPAKSSRFTVNRLRLLDAATGEERGRYEAPQVQDVTAAALGDGGEVLAVLEQYKEKTVVVRTVLGSGAVGRRHAAADGKAILCVAFSPDGKALATTDAEAAYLWDLAAGKERLIYATNSLPMNQVAFSAGGETLLAGYPGAVKLWDAATGKERATLAAHLYGRVSADGKTVFVMGENNTVPLHDAATGKERGVLKAPESGDGEDRWDSVRGSPHGKWACVTTTGGEVLLWDVEARKVLKTWKRRAHLADLAFAPDEKTLLTSDGEETLRIWDIPSLHERASLVHGWTPDSVVAFSPDGKTAALAGADAVVKLVDLATGEERARLRGSNQRASGLAFSPDGKTLAASGADGQVRLWDPLTGDERLVLGGDSGPILCLEFSPDGEVLATGDADGLLQLWSVKAGRVTAPAGPPENPNRPKPKAQ